MTAPLLDAATLAEMRAIQEANMPSSCALIGNASVRNAGGNYDLTPVVLLTVKCRLTAVGASAGLVAEQIASLATFLLYLPANTDMTGVESAVVTGVTDGIEWTVSLVLAGLEEPRSYSAAVRVRANRAPGSVLAETEVGSVTITAVP